MSNILSDKIELKEMINGKPYCGIWIGVWSCLDISEDLGDKFMENIIVKVYIEWLRKKIPPHLVLRHESIIYRPLVNHGQIIMKSTIALKGILWGRSFEIMKLLRKGTSRFKKVYRSGKRKKVKI